MASRNEMFDSKKLSLFLFVDERFFAKKKRISIEDFFLHSR